ncbi:MAG: DUF4383 domain-containing protein [Acidobacteriota bacterium]|nr:DUF4383 domain-containing protein [Acidobacteriota bacterium]
MIRKFALIFGVIYVIAGVSGFIPGLNPHHMDETVKFFRTQNSLCSSFYFLTLNVFQTA